jgi:Uma2 family endonuclease
MFEAPMLTPPLVKPQRFTKIQYPESDGKPVGETEYHVIALLHVLDVLRFYYRHHDNVYVGGNMLFYYQEGNPAVFKVPDVFVVKGIAKHVRRIYKLWEERVAPSVVFEITSRGTRREDFGSKRTLYEELGVREYYLFDPMDEYLSPSLQGFQLVDGRYQPVLPEEDGSLISQELGLVLRPSGAMLRIHVPGSEQPLPTLDEAMNMMQDAIEVAQSEVQRAQTEAQRAAAAEARSAQLETEVDRLRRLLDELS